MGFGGGSSQQQQPTQTTTTQISPQAQQLFDVAFPNIRNFAASVPSRYPGATVAPFDPWQTTGQYEAAYNAAPLQRELAQRAINMATEAGSNLQDVPGYIGWNPEFMSWDPNVNPQLNEAIKATQRPIFEQLTERALPAVRGGAIAAGGYGGSRQGIAEGIATRGAEQAAADAARKIVQDMYSTNIQAMGQRYGQNLEALGQRYGQNIGARLGVLGQTPMLQQAVMTPAQTVSGAGDVRQQQAQAETDAAVRAYNYDQLAPFLQSKEILSLVSGFPGGQTISTANVPQANKWTQALGGAASGAALGSAVFPGIGTGVGALGGALLPFLFG